jgi:hypothetical protein
LRRQAFGTLVLLRGTLCGGRSMLGTGGEHVACLIVPASCTW